MNVWLLCLFPNVLKDSHFIAFESPKADNALSVSVGMSDPDGIVRHNYTSGLENKITNFHSNHRLISRVGVGISAILQNAPRLILEMASPGVLTPRPLGPGCLTRTLGSVNGPLPQAGPSHYSRQTPLFCRPGKKEGPTS